VSSQAIAGYGARLLVSTDGGATYSAVGEIRDVTLTLSLETIDVTSHDSAGWKESIPGAGSWSASGEALYVAADAAQSAVYSALVDKQKVKFRFEPQAGSGKPKYEGDGIITSWEVSGPNTDAAAVSLEIEGTGALAKGAQA